MFVELNLGTTAFSREAPKHMGWVSDKKSLAQFQAELAKRLRISLTEGKSLWVDELSNVMKIIAKEDPNIKPSLRETLVRNKNFDSKELKVLRRVCIEKDRLWRVSVVRIKLQLVSTG